MFRFLSIFLLSNFLISLPALAQRGGWSGGGGEVIEDLHNPWFSEKKEVVLYCIDIDRSSVSADPQTIEIAVERAVMQWARIFKNYLKEHPRTRVKTGTQAWLKLSCNEKVDVRFQFGWGTLTSAQKQFLARDGDPLRFIGYAVRTEYDRSSLNAKGFVYIASDRGTHSFLKREGQRIQPWKYPSVLFLELTHELGHVFGLKHAGSSLFLPYRRSIMAEDFPELAISAWIGTQNPTELSSICELDDYFNPTQYEDCSLRPDQKKWFGVGSDTECLRFTVKKENEFPSSIAFETRTKTGKFQKFEGSVKLKRLVNWNFRDEIYTYVTKSQNVYPGLKADQNYLSGPGSDYGDSAGYYASEVPSPTVPVLGLFREDSLKILVADPISLELYPVATAYPSNACLYAQP